MGDRTAQLLASLPASFRGSVGEADLEGRIEAMLATARAAWPGVHVADDAMLRRLAAVLSADDRPVREQLDGLHTDGLYLAAGCLARVPEALARFDALLEEQAAAALAPMRLDATLSDEVKQRVRVRLLVDTPAGAAAGLASYLGRGDLRAWVRVCATRMAITALRELRPAKERGDDEALLDLAAPADDPEMQHLKDRYRAELRAAFVEALATLADRQRAVLRRSFLDDLSIDQIGAIYGVHRATAARWIAAAQERLLVLTREALARRLGADSVEVESVMRLVQSRLDLAASALRQGLDG